MKNKGPIYGKIKSAKKSARISAGKLLQNVEKYDCGLHFGITDTQYSEFLALKKKWGLRSIAEAARRIWTRGLQIEKSRKDKKWERGTR